MNKAKVLGKILVRIRPAVSTLLLGALYVGVAHANPAYDQLVMQAREGTPAPLLLWLEQNQSSLSAQQLADWLQVSEWAKQDAESIRVWKGLSKTQQLSVPARGWLAVARAYRNLQQWQDSLSMWQAVLRRDSGQSDARAGWIMTLADAGRTTEARRQADLYVQQLPSYQSYQVFLYVFGDKNNGNVWDELFALTLLYDQGGRGPKLDHLMVQTLSSGDVAAPALQQGLRLQIDGQAMRKLELRQAAELVRVAQTESRGEAEKFLVADRALDRYKVLLEKWRVEPDTADDIAHARVDRIGAYVARQDYQAAVSEYEALVAQNISIPGYAQRWAAGAYLSIRQPEKAYELFQGLFANEPLVNLEEEEVQEYFFSALESERIEDGRVIAQQVINDAPYYSYHYGSPMEQPNDSWLLGRVLHGQYLQKANKMRSAQRASIKLSDGGPGNQGLRINRAEVLLSRGLPRQAERELKIAEAAQASNLQLERQQAYVAQRLQEWQQFDILVADVVARSPNEPGTKQLARAHQVENFYEFRLAGSKGLSSGNPVSGSRDFNLYSALYAPRQAEHWRPFVGFDYSTGRFEEGKGHRRIQALGVEYTRRNNWAELEVSNHRTRGGDKMGFRFSYWHDFNDNWRVGSDMERLSRETPLRAVRNGVTSNRVGGYVRWYENERREYQLNLSGSHFSDGNNRKEYGLLGKERLLTRPYFTLDVLPSLSVSTNSKDDGPYYSPKRDVHAAATLFADHILYRRYETVWRQQFLLGAGHYWQKNYSGGMSLSAGYGQRYATNSVLDMGAMLIWSRQPYDGDREHDLSLVFDLNYRF